MNSHALWTEHRFPVLRWFISEVCSFPEQGCHTERHWDMQTEVPSLWHWVHGTSQCKEINLTPVTEMNLLTVRSSWGGLLLMGLTSDCSTFRPSQWVKNLLAMQEMKADASLIPGLGRSPGGGQGYPLQYSYLENPMDRGPSWATVHGIARVGDNWATKHINYLNQLMSKVKHCR